MFSAGTRVYVYSSSIIGKKLGPKRHSMGYVSDSNSTIYTDFIKEFPIKNQAFALTPITVVFTRYGKEEKRRLETRSFLNVLPTFLNTKNLVLQQRIKEIISCFNDGELSKNSHWQDISLNFGIDSGCVGTLVPIISKVEKMDAAESIAWITSIMKNKVFANLLMHNKNLTNLRSLGSSDLIVWIANAATNQNTSHRDIIQWAEYAPQNMSKLIALIRCINTAFNKRLSDSLLDQMSIKLKTGGVDINNFLTWYTNGLFENESLIAKKYKISQPKQIGNALANIADSMRTVRSEYLNLKLKHI